MKNLDLFSKRILVIACSISLVLLSLSAFLLTISRVTAQSANTNYQPFIVGMGVDKDQMYYARFDHGQYQLFKIPVSKATPEPYLFR